MTRVKVTGSQAFVNAAVRLMELRMGKHGDLKKMSSKMGIRPSYLIDLLKGRRRWSDRLKEKFATHIGFSEAEIYMMGEELAETGHLFPYARKVVSTESHSIERATMIYNLVGEEFNLGDVGLLNEKTLAAWNPTGLDKYLDGKLSDGAFYSILRDIVTKFLEHYIQD